MKYDIIIIGAGAAGLMALNELTRAGYRVCLLEATGNIGGRIHTVVQPDTDETLEYGAEFIHGEAPLTIELLKRAGMSHTPVGGRFYTVMNGVWMDEEDRDEYYDMITEKMRSVKEDCTILQFLDEHLPEAEHEHGRKMLQGFAEGFSLADISKASLLAFYNDWTNQQEEQRRVKGGYGMLMNYLLSDCDSRLATVHFFSPVVRIVHRPGQVIAYTAGNKQYEASKIIITCSAGVLQSGSIQFDPVPAAHIQAIHDLGFGSVVKILFRFKEPFWNRYAGDTGFMLTNETIPTWWTQLPDHAPLLTGWVGGPRAARLNDLPGDELYDTALASLAKIFKLDDETLRSMLVQHKMICWDELPYVRGGYSYNTPRSAGAKKTLTQPVNNTIYFSGEAIYGGASQATVEAALSSGKETAAQMIKSVKNVD